MVSIENHLSTSYIKRLVKQKSIPIVWVKDTDSRPLKILKEAYGASTSLLSLLLQRPVWSETDDYDSSFGWIDVRARTVLDVGADYGSTTKYFLKRGAAKVIAVEPDPYLFKALCNLGARVAPIRSKIGSADQFERLICHYSPQVAKIDCEGAEVYLAGLSDEVLRLVRVWAIDIHRKTEKILVPIFGQAGFETQLVKGQMRCRLRY